MIKRLIWTIWTPMSSVLKKADKLNLSLSSDGHYESGYGLISGLQSLYYHPVNDLFPSIMYRNQDWYALQYNVGIFQFVVIEYFLCIFMEQKFFESFKLYVYWSRQPRVFQHLTSLLSRLVVMQGHGCLSQMDLLPMSQKLVKSGATGVQTLSPYFWNHWIDLHRSKFYIP